MVELVLGTVIQVTGVNICSRDRIEVGTQVFSCALGVGSNALCDKLGYSICCFCVVMKRLVIPAVIREGTSRHRFTIWSKKAASGWYLEVSGDRSYGC